MKAIKTKAGFCYAVLCSKRITGLYLGKGGIKQIKAAVRDV